MPLDLAIMTPLSTLGPLTPDQKRATGNTTAIFDPFQNDIQFDRRGALVTYEGTDKLIQSIIRLILTDQGSYSMDLNWGTILNTLIGTKFDQTRYANTQQSIQDGLIYYNQVNQDNPDSDEIINTIDQLQVVQDLNDPRAMRIYLGVTTESGISFRVSTPQVG